MTTRKSSRRRYPPREATQRALDRGFHRQEGSSSEGFSNQYLVRVHCVRRVGEGGLDVFRAEHGVGGEEVCGGGVLAEAAARFGLGDVLDGEAGADEDGFAEHFAGLRSMWWRQFMGGR